MGSVFGYKHVSFNESPRTTVHCMTVCHISTCILFNCWIVIIIEIKMFGLIYLWWNVYFVYTWTLIILINLLGCEAPYWVMWNAHSIFKFFRCKYGSWVSAYGTRRVSRCHRGFWSRLEDSVIFFCVWLFENML